jgi:hypothetical protein
MPLANRSSRVDSPASASSNFWRARRPRSSGWRPVLTVTGLPGKQRMLDIPPESFRRSSSNHSSNPTRPTLSMQRQLLKPFRVLPCALCSQRQKLNLICRRCTVSGSDSCPARPLSSTRHGPFCSNMASPLVLALRTLFATCRRFSRTMRTGLRHQCAVCSMSYGRNIGASKLACCNCGVR